jgi:3-hydroxybutyryl-CoA dehydrogenase
MEASAIQRIVVIGTGMMGPGIAQCFAAAGRSVTLVSRSDEGLARGRAAIAANLRALHEAGGLISSEEVSSTIAATRWSTDLSAAVADADLVVESIVENLGTKQALFARLDQLCPPRALLASNTSGLPITEISAAMTHPERAATTHFWNPPHLMPLVEIVKGEQTSEDTVGMLHAVLSEIGKRPVIVHKDVPGQLGNRLLHALTREAMHIVQEGIATAEEVDTAIKTGLGLRMPVYGLLEHADLVGLDLVLAIESYLFRDLCNRSEPLKVLKDMAERGDLGARTGQGFYDWTQRDAAQVKANRDAFLMARLRDLYPPKDASSKRR